MKRRWLIVSAIWLGLAGDTAAGAANCAGIERLRQGDLVVRQAPAGSSAQLDGRPLQVSADGWYAFGIARDARKPITLEVHTPGAAPCRVTLAVQARNWPDRKDVGRGRRGSVSGYVGGGRLFKN